MDRPEVGPHPLAIRWFHWVHFPVIALMIWSGTLIYWANQEYVVIPSNWASRLGINYHLAEGMGWHFLLMGVFALNGAAYLVYLLWSGEWRAIIPRPSDWRRALQVALHDLHLRREAPPKDGKYNSAQRIAYTGVLLMGAGSLVTGLAMYKPVQLGWLASLLDGYEAARLEHFILTWLFVLFFFIHVAQVVRAGWKSFVGMVSFRHFKVGIFILVSGYFTASIFFREVREGERVGGAPKVLRQSFLWNQDLWEAYQSNRRVSVHRETPHPGTPPRFNGDLGLQSALNLQKYQFRVESGSRQFDLPISAVLSLPKIAYSTEFRCIEGWTDTLQYSGARFSEFMKAYGLGVKPDGSYYRYVGLETPDRGYYVSIDIDSMMHPQTLLAYELNSAPIDLKNGAPLRLVIPIKYGIKSLKRIGRIYFSDTRPPDYWEEQGYDWWSGL